MEAKVLYKLVFVKTVSTVMVMAYITRGTSRVTMMITHTPWYKNYIIITSVYREKKTSLYLLCDDYVLSIADGTSVSTFLCT